MSLKRLASSNPYKIKNKRVCTTLPKSSIDNNTQPQHDLENDKNCTVETALRLLRSLFHQEKFENRIPPIIMKHQIYALIDNKTSVDKRLNELRNQGEIRFFKTGPQDDEIAVVYTDDYRDCVLRRNNGNKTIENFISEVVASCPNVSYQKNDLIGNYLFKEEQIIELVQHGLLTVRDVGTWWLSIPHVGEFMKFYMQGQKALISTIKRCKFKEILRNDLKNKKLTKVMKLGMEYHLYDIIGAELVSCIETSSGQLLRINDS